MVTVNACVFSQIIENTVGDAANLFIFNYLIDKYVNIIVFFLNMQHYRYSAYIHRERERDIMRNLKRKGKFGGWKSVQSKVY